MNRNVESHFSELPSIDIERSTFDRSSSHKTSFDVGQLIPFYIDEVLPGDTFNITTSVVARLQTLLTPIMDNMYLDTYWFFVPNRLTWNHWKEFMGENTSGYWIPNPPHAVPQIKFPENGFASGTIADYMGVPVGVQPANDQITISALPFRAYALICDEWFRDQNVQQNLYIDKDDTTRIGSNGSNPILDVALGGKPFIANKYHDLFSSCLPGPLKSEPITIFGTPISSPVGAFVPVSTGADQYADKTPPPYSSRIGLYGYLNSETNPTQGYLLGRGAASGTGTNVTNALLRDTSNSLDFMPTNLWADVGQMQLTINQLRIAFQLQKYYERNARSGTRYREIIKAHFGTTSPDARMMIPEYLGGHRVPITIHQIANQSQGEADFLGDLGAMSNTSDVHDDFVKSFTEHGFLIGVCCVRYDHTYAQGLDRMWTRKDKLNYYWPVFANLGEQPVYKYEINLMSDSYEGEVFGYNEAWCEYRYKPNRVSGEMRPNVSNSLASWHLADNYASQVSLSDSWMREDKTNVDRVLAVTSSNANQIFADFYVQNMCTRPMPMYSIPGLIDHH